MTERQRPYSDDEPVIGATYPVDPADDAVGTYETEFDDEPDGYIDETDDEAYIGGDPGAPDADEYAEWDDEYDDPYAEQYYDDEYYEEAPARQPLFYVIIGLAVVLGGLLIFLLFQLLGGSDNGAVTAAPDFNVTIDQPLENERINVGDAIDVRVRANATEPITALELRLNGEVVDDEAFDQEPEDGIYSATLQFTVEAPDTYTLIARAVSESGASSDSLPVTVIAVEPIDERPSEIRGEVISNVNARRGPGDDFEAVRTLSAGDTVTVVGRTEDSQWLLLDDGTWVRRAAIDLSESIDLLEVREATPTPEPTETPEPSPSPTSTPEPAAPDFTPSNASLHSGGTILRITISNISSAGYEGPLVVRASGLDQGTVEQVFAVNIGSNGATTVDFVLSRAQTSDATLQVAVDPDRTIDESSRDNNSATFVLAAPVEPPNLVIVDAGVDGSTVSVTVLNDGGDLSSSDISVQVALGGETNQASTTTALPTGETVTLQVARPSGSGDASVRVLLNGERVSSATILIAADPTPTPQGTG